MRKSFILLSVLSVAIMLVGCNNDENLGIIDEKTKSQLETEVYFQGQKLFYESQEPQTGVRAKIQVINPAGGLAWPKHTDDGWESARFSIRADGTIPDFYDKSSSLYYGRPAGKAGVTSRNVGKVSNLYNYPHYNDRDLDYYKVDKKTGNNIGLFRYIYDTEGQKTQPVILEAPSVVEILADEVVDLEAEINAGKNVAKNQAALDNVNALIDKGADYLDSHVLWYVVKEVAGQYRWHVNGVIRDVETPEYVPNHIPDNVEVDVHQQSHKDWNEIKTSIHVRTDCSSVKVIIPLKEEDILEQDDFAIRVFNFYYQDYVIKHNIKHDANGITIEITDIPASLIEQCKTDFGDGITIEIHSYCTKDVWEELKNSRVQTGKSCNVEGQVSSALRPGEEVQIHVEQSH
ncbi:MAG: hypothetical protein IKO73_09865 [Bacteroidaceae bacterium]|nr:hypothetical protein [Bacteroidaceae bacterium]